MDLKSLSLRPDSAGLGIFKECARIDQAFYPERLGEPLGPGLQFPTPGLNGCSLLRALLPNQLSVDFQTALGDCSTLA